MAMEVPPTRMPGGAPHPGRPPAGSAQGRRTAEPLKETMR